MNQTKPRHPSQLAYRDPTLCTQGLNLDPETEKYIQDLMATDPQEIKYRADREMADAVFDELMDTFEREAKERELAKVRAGEVGKPMKIGKLGKGSGKRGKKRALNAV